jgi:hypothetical protein
MHLSASAPAFIPAAQKMTSESISPIPVSTIADQVEQHSSSSKMATVKSLVDQRSAKMAKNRKMFADQAAFLAGNEKKHAQRTCMQNINKMIAQQGLKRDDSELVKTVIDNRVVARQAAKRAAYKELLAQEAEKKRAAHKELLAQEAEKRAAYKELLAQEAAKRAAYKELLAQEAEKKRAAHKELLAQEAEKKAAKRQEPVSTRHEKASENTEEIIAAARATEHTQMRSAGARTSSDNEWNAVSFANAIANSSTREEVPFCWYDDKWH